jgi:hypothetical protein
VSACKILAISLLAVKPEDVGSLSSLSSVFLCGQEVSQVTVLCSNEDVLEKEILLLTFTIISGLFL